MSILKLPNELFLHIFDDLEETDLFALAKSCRDLNIIATSSFFSRRNITNPIKAVKYPGPILPFLRVTVLPISIGYLHGFLTTSREIDGLERLVVKLSSVKMVVLATQGTHDDDHFFKALHALLAAVAARACETLYISRYSKPIASSAKENIYNIDLPTTSKLSNLSISSVSLFDSSFLQWIAKLINASPINHLTIVNIYQGFFFWDDFLSGIHSTTLSEVWIRDDCHQIPLSSFATFLVRHPNITSLHCQGLFRDDQDVTAFPSLREIDLNVYLCRCIRPFDPIVVNNSLECAARCPNEIELSLEFDQEDDTLPAWFDLEVNDESRIERSLDRVISLTLRGGLPRRPMKAESISIIPMWLSLFPALRLLTFQYRSDEWTPRLKFACSVIRACSQLETLTINGETHPVAGWLAMEDSSEGVQYSVGP